MAEKFIPGGPPRYKHQKSALKFIIELGGTAALLMEPGLGKTGTALDFASLLALKQPEIEGVKECRVLVIAPLAAVDTWVQEAATFVSPQVNYWAEALGGSIIERAEALAARGGQSFPFWNDEKLPSWLKVGTMEEFDDEGNDVVFPTVTCTKCKKTFKLDPDASTKRWIRKHVRTDHKEIRLRLPLQQRAINGVYMETPKRAEGWSRAIDWGGRASEGRHLRHSDGPDGLGSDKPRLIIEAINIDTLSSRAAISSSKTVADYVLEGIRRYSPHLVIIDESHKIKSHTSNVSRMADRISQTVNRRMILTGTVMPAGPLDIFAQWRFLDPHAFGELDDQGVRKRATFASFEARFAVKGGYLGHQVVGYRNMDDLQSIMSQRSFVVRKKDALDLPPVTEVVVPVMLSATEKRAYMQMKKELALQFGNGATATVQNRLTQMMRLRQITAGHLPDDLGIVRDLGSSKASVISSIVHDQLPDRKRILIFTLFSHELEVVAKKLARDGTRVEAISGGTPNGERIAIRKRFGDLANYPQRTVLVAQIKTLSLAVNELVTAQDIIFGSLSQQRDDLIQAIDRLNRIGQLGDKVTVYFTEAPGTIDTVIHQSHRDGTALEGAVLDHVLGANPWMEDE